MDLIKPLVRHCTHDMYDRRDGFWPGRFRGELSASEFASRDELHAMQLSRLRRVLEVAQRDNEFYRHRFRESGFEAGDCTSLEDLSGLPVLTKRDIREGLVNSFTSRFHASNTFPRRTGGSTGVPVLVFHDFEAASAKRAAAQRHNAWANWNVGDRVARVWGDVRENDALKARLRNALTGRAICLDTLRFEPDHLMEFVAQAQKYAPEIIYGHAHSIYRFAEFLMEHGESLPPVKGIVTTSMVLSDGERRTMESVFGAEVFDRYGCHETSIIASECGAHDGLHIFAEGVLVEIESAIDGRPGRVLLTDLLNIAMPLIRYEVGDMALLSEGTCACGRSLPRLKSIAGRTADFLYRPDGTPVFGISILDTFVIHIPGIEQLQIVQDRLDHIDLNLCRASDFSEDTLALLRWEIQNVFGAEMQHDVRFVDRIEQTPSGKYRFSICNLPGRQPAPEGVLQ